MRFTVCRRIAAPLAFGTLLISSLWTTGVEQPTTAGAAQVQRYPFDPRYSHVACSDEKPQAALPKSTNPPSVVPLLAAAGSHFLSSITCTWGYLVVLKPGSEALAAQIRARFGPAVRVFIGPDPAKPTWNCWPFLKSTQPPRGLEFSLHLDSTKVPSGGHFGGHLTITNRSATPFLMDTGQPLLVRGSACWHQANRGWIHGWSRRNGIQHTDRQWAELSGGHPRGHESMRRERGIPATGQVPIDR